MEKETKLNILKDIERLTKGIIRTTYIDYKTKKKKVNLLGIELKCDRWGNCSYLKDELIHIRKWLKKHLIFVR